VGKLGDIYGKKRVLSVVLIVYTVAVSVTGFSPTFEFMVVSRAVQGVGLTVFPLAMSLVREEFPREMIPRAQGILSALFGAGFAISLPLGAWVSNGFGWEFTYHTAIPFVVAATVAAFVFLRESPFRRPEAKVDYTGAVLLASSLALFVFALAQGPTWGWTSTAVLGMALAGGLLLIPLAWYELRLHRRQAEVILDFRLLGMRNVLVTNILGLVSGFGMFLAFQSLTFQLRDPPPTGFGQDIFQVGLSFLAFALPMLVFAPLASVLATRWGTKPLTIVGCLIGAVGFALATQANTLDLLLGCMVVMGAGIAITNAAMINLLVLTVNPREMGLATSMSATFRNIGSSVGAPLAGSIMATFTVSSIYGPLPSQAAYNASFVIAAALITVFAREVLGRRAVLVRTDEPTADGTPRVIAKAV
jgi:MFS family permease